MQDETVWLTQQQLMELYQSSKSNVSEHIKHIFEEGELDEECEGYKLAFAFSGATSEEDLERQLVGCEYEL